jgi:hypothetical protein
LFECDCRAPLHHQVFASDATTTRGAAVFAEPSCVELSWLWARTPRRGAYARLFLDGGIDSVLDKSDVRDELVYEVVRQLQFRPCLSWTLPTEQHIGLQEMAALAAVVRRLARDPRCWGRRVVMIVDARVIRHAVTRGRSSSRILNRALRRLLAHHLLTGIRLVVMWVPTDVNAADDPTRHRPVRPAEPRSAEVLAALRRFSAANPHVLEVVIGQGLCPSDPDVHGPQYLVPSGEEPSPSGPMAVPSAVPVPDAHLAFTGGSSGGQASGVSGLLGLPPMPVGLVAAVDSDLCRQSVPRAVCPQTRDATRSPPAQRLPKLLDVFCGASSPIAAAAERAGWEVVRFDIQLDLSHDLTDDSILEALCERVASGEFDLVFLAPPCGTFSVFMRLSKSSSRSLARPMGGGRGRPLTPKERLANKLLHAAESLVCAADSAGSQWVLENPAGSLLWRCPPLRRMMSVAEPSRVQCTFEWCRFGRPWAKSTRLVGSAPWITRLGRRCRRDHEHERLQGGVQVQGRWVDRTALAATYSPEFARAVVRLATSSLDARTRARYGLRGVRVGDARITGPPRLPMASVPVLSEGVSAVTMARYDQRLGELELWLQRHRLGSLRALSQSDR